MIVLNGYESHLSVQFKKFYKKKNIIILCLLIYSSHFIQPLDIDCFNILKWLYGKELKDFIKIYINYITKTEFLFIFKAAHFKIMTTANIQVGFRDVGLMPYDLQTVISKLDIKLQTSTSIGPPLFEVNL